MMAKSRSQATLEAPAQVSTTEEEEGKKAFDAYLDALAQRAAKRGEKPWPQNDNTQATEAANPAKSNNGPRRNDG